MSNNKMKGLLKGLRYISQIFENEKEPEMQIGYPTDVKHVAHIGWDGPSVSSPSWMNEFKGPQEDLAGPVDVGRDSISSQNGLSEDSERRSLTSKNSPARDQSEIPKSARRHSTGASSEAPAAKERTRQPRRSTKNSPARDLTDSPKANESPSRNLPVLPKKSRRKKSKDSSVGGSSRCTTSRSKSQAPESYTSPFSDPGSGNVSRFKSSNDHIQTPNLNPFRDG